MSNETIPTIVFGDPSDTKKITVAFSNPEQNKGVTIVICDKKESKDGNIDAEYIVKALPKNETIEGERIRLRFETQESLKSFIKVLLHSIQMINET
jgi:hypothetical protein